MAMNRTLPTGDMEPPGDAAESGKPVDFLSMPGHLLRRCHQIGVAVFLEECRAFELTPLQYSVLAALERFGPMEQVSLGGVTALDRTTVIVVLTKLEEAGMVTRAPSEKDRRAKIVTLSEAGSRMLGEVRPSVIEAQQRMLAPLNMRERDQLLALLKKMAEGNNALSRAPHRLP
ncbi:MarR family transcriptional regulator (plasmid) [Agrobacterium leguminum]|uniref:MarR family winged helix-turn-helix transcriptional regulator n=1 Tax=Agrobacterium leguminum TaxID=2792015 RepID=UPI002729F8DE|nr:MarR family transcriptional regulator [Agrobacterium leguminum]WLE00566.1 MarR family transcriptional regulator [Agrobacterium leguminum]